MRGNPVTKMSPEQNALEEKEEHARVEAEKATAEAAIIKADLLGEKEKAESAK